SPPPARQYWPSLSHHASNASRSCSSVLVVMVLLLLCEGGSQLGQIRLCARPAFQPLNGLFASTPQPLVFRRKLAGGLYVFSVVMDQRITSVNRHHRRNHIRRTFRVKLGIL